MKWLVATAVSFFLVTRTIADYGGGAHHRRQQNIKILPAGLSKAHHWIGVGDYSPEYIPKPFKAPRWIPHVDPSYTATWVPFAPKPRINSRAPSYGGSFGRNNLGDGGYGGANPQGFGPPKGNTLVGILSGGGNYGNHHQSGHGHGFDNFDFSNHQSSGGSYNRNDVVLQDIIQPMISFSQHVPSSSVLRNPETLQVIDSYSEPSFNSLSRVPISSPQSSQFYRSGGSRLQATLHVGSPQPGAESPTTLGINYKPPKPEDVINMSSLQSKLTNNKPVVHIPISANSVAGEGLVSSSYSHV